MSANPEPLSAARIGSHLGVIAAVAVAMGLLVGGLAIPFAVGAGIGARGLASSVASLPKTLETEPLRQASKILDNKGNVIATFYDENRINVKYEQISPAMVNAIVAVEDYRFWKHGAIDLKGTLRAALKNLASGGQVVQGGSSITQQMAKLTLLAQAKTESEKKAATADTLARKITELRHAIAFEQNHSKKWILTRYLNIAFFGDQSHGIQAAARHYFSVDAKDLNVQQAAMLAGLVKNPNVYNPTASKDAALSRRNVVLDQMQKYGYLSRGELADLKAKPLGLKRSPNRNGCISSVAPIFCDYVYNFLMADPALGETKQGRENLLRNGGLTISTTMDPRFQAAADRSTSTYVGRKDQAVGALASVQPGTGLVRAVSQSRPLGLDPRKGETTLNFAIPTELGKAQRFQAGSTFKVFVLAAALEEGINPRTSLWSPPTLDISQNSFPDCRGNYPVGSNYHVSNSTGSGVFSLYTGTQHSVNTFFIKLTKMTGLCDPWRLARSMGMTLTNTGSHPTRTPNFALGAAGSSPLETASAYATFGSRGTYCKPLPIVEIRNSEGGVFKKYDPECKRVMSEYTADVVNDVLRGVQLPGGFGYGAGLSLTVPSAGKTGTTQDNKAVWFSGYTPDLATAAVIGGSNKFGIPITLKGQVVGGRYVSSSIAFGSTLAGPMWGAEMKAIVRWLPGNAFVLPGAPPVNQQAAIIEQAPVKKPHCKHPDPNLPPDPRCDLIPPDGGTGGPTGGGHGHGHGGGF